MYVHDAITEKGLILAGGIGDSLIVLNAALALGLFLKPLLT